MIPTCLNLRQDQIDKLKQWAGTLPKIVETEEDAVPYCTIEFRVRSTGLGDEIYAVSGDRKCYLSIDDDGNLIDIPGE